MLKLLLNSVIGSLRLKASPRLRRTSAASNDTSSHSRHCEPKAWQSSLSKPKAWKLSDLICAWIATRDKRVRNDERGLSFLLCQAVRLGIFKCGLLIIAHSAYAMTVEEQLKKREKEIQEVAKGFESTLISRSLKSMYEGIKTDPIAGGGHAEGLYRELLLEEYAKIISKGEGFKLGKYIERDIKRGDTMYKNLLRAQDEEKSKQASKQ